MWIQATRKWRHTLNFVYGTQTERQIYFSIWKLVSKYHSSRLWGERFPSNLMHRKKYKIKHTPIRIIFSIFFVNAQEVKWFDESLNRIIRNRNVQQRNFKPRYNPPSVYSYPSTENNWTFYVQLPVWTHHFECICNIYWLKTVYKKHTLSHAWRVERSFRSGGGQFKW